MFYIMLNQQHSVSKSILSVSKMGCKKQNLNQENA